MKRILIFLALLPILATAQVDDDSLRTYTDTYVISNAARLITGNIMNTILQDLIDSKENVDSAFVVTSVSGDTLFVSYNGSTDTILATGGADNLGNHTLDSNLRTNGYWISNDGDDEGIYVNSSGYVGVNDNSVTHQFEMNGDYYQRSSLLNPWELNSSEVTGVQMKISNTEGSWLQGLSNTENYLFIKGAGDTVATLTDSSFIIQNNGNADLVIQSDFDDISDAESSISFEDGTTPIWEVKKDESNDFIVLDAINGENRIKIKDGNAEYNITMEANEIQMGVGSSSYIFYDGSFVTPSGGSQTIGSDMFMWDGLYTTGITDDGTDVTISATEIYLSGVDNDETPDYSLGLNTDDEVVYFAVPSGSADSTYVTIQTDSIYELTADEGVYIEGLKFEHDTITGDEIYLVGVDEDVTPTRNLGQNDDGEVVYSEVAYGNWHTGVVPDSTYPNTELKTVVFDDDGTYGNEESINITNVGDTIIRPDVSGVFHISINFVATNPTTTTAVVGHIYINDTDVITRQRQYTPNAPNQVCLSAIASLSANDEIKLKIYGYGNQIDIAELSINIHKIF